MSVHDQNRSMLHSEAQLGSLMGLYSGWPSLGDSFTRTIMFASAHYHWLPMKIALWAKGLHRSILTLYFHGCRQSSPISRLTSVGAGQRLNLSSATIGADQQLHLPSAATNQKSTHSPAISPTRQERTLSPQRHSLQATNAQLATSSNALVPLEPALHTQASLAAQTAEVSSGLA